MLSGKILYVKKNHFFKDIQIILDLLQLHLMDQY